MYKYGQEHRPTSSNFQLETALEGEITENVETEDAGETIEQIIVDYSNTGETDAVEAYMAETPTPKKGNLKPKNVIILIKLTMF